MAAIAQSEPYSVFIRKIGYSVGLEGTFERAAELTRHYVERKDITLADWNLLVHSDQYWGLKNDRIADFFRSIELVRKAKGDVHVLPGLDALALAYLELSGGAEFEVALRVILGSHIVIADGDVFLNCLSGQFEREKVEQNLKEMIIYKREAIARVVTSPQLVQRLAKAIAIDVQASNVGGTNARKTLSERLRREPLGLRTEPLSRIVNLRQVDISEDYFRKVLGRRRDWGRSLGLVDAEGRLTGSGNSFLRSFAELGAKCTSDAYAYWPFAFELERIALSAEKLGIPSISLWDHVMTVSKGLEQELEAREMDSDSYVIGLVERLFRFYQVLSARRRMLRREMPIGILFHAVAGCYAAKRRALPNLPKVLSMEIRREQTRLISRSSRLFEGTVSFKI